MEFDMAARDAAPESSTADDTFDPVTVTVRPVARVLNAADGVPLNPTTVPAITAPVFAAGLDMAVDVGCVGLATLLSPPQAPIEIVAARNAPATTNLFADIVLASRTACHLHSELFSYPTLEAWPTGHRQQSQRQCHGLTRLGIP
jgi:hypothetical protein